MSRLTETKLLASLPIAERAEIERQCHWRRFEREAEILERASANRDVFFIAEGEVQIVNYALSGRPVAYATLGPGEFFGELAAIDGEPRSATVVARTPCVVGNLPPERFLKLMSDHPEVALAVMRRLARIIRVCDERIIDLATLGAMQRVVVELCRASRPDPITAGSWLIYPCPAQREFAARASTTRETVARVFSQLQDSGQIHRKGRTLYIHDRGRLEQIAQRLSPAPA